MDRAATSDEHRTSLIDKLLKNLRYLDIGDHHEIGLLVDLPQQKIQASRALC